MILYLDASALVKRYIIEPGSDQVNAWIAAADAVVTGLITRTEVAAAICRAGRMQMIDPAEVWQAVGHLRAEWESLERLPVTEATVARGDLLACEYGLRGYEAVHLATAILWQESLGDPVTIATYDTQLRVAAKRMGMAVLP